jgi:4,5-DOPA dioxygenase extradiol
VYDFSGFPDELYRVRYPAPPAPEVALRVESLAGPVARSDRGLDHGVWTPLVHLFPRADVPVLQLSMPRSATSSWLFDLGRRLAPLRDEDVLLLASGNLVHNLSRASWGEPAPTPPWAEAFDSWIRGVLERRDLDALLDYERRSPDVEEAHPTREHFRPLLVAAGAGAEDGVTFPVTGWEMGSISRRSAQFG